MTEHEWIDLVSKINQTGEDEFKSIYNSPMYMWDLVISRMCEIDKAIQAIDKIYNQVSELHPYKEPGNRDSYSEYNEGWSDACEEIRIRLIKELKKLKE